MKRALVFLALFAPAVPAAAEGARFRADATQFVASNTSLATTDFRPKALIVQGCCSISLETGKVTMESGVTVDAGARKFWQAVEMIGGLERLVPQERVYLQYTDAANWVRVVIGAPGEYGPRVERAGTGYGFRFSELNPAAPRVRRKGD